MDFPFSEEFKSQAAIYNLKYRCADCGHFNSDSLNCSFEYPIGEHKYFYIMKFPKQSPAKFSFCKYFEVD